jgi:transcriptional regulator GlxA family with amidase domain
MGVHDTAQHPDRSSRGRSATRTTPAHPWTVARLAWAASVSQATLARRFTDGVGEPPIMYLTRTRIDLAAGLLCAPGTTVAAVAHRVGSGGPSALSNAFKRVRDPLGRAPLTAGRAVHHRAARHRTTAGRLTGLTASP